jgi:hypothetical protein
MMKRLFVAIALALVGCGGGGDSEFPGRGLFHFTAPGQLPIVSYPIQSEPGTAFIVPVEVSLVWRDDVPRRVLLRSETIALSRCAAPLSDAIATQVEVQQGDSATLAVVENGLLLEATRPGWNVFRVSGQIRCSDRSFESFSYELRVSVEAPIGYEIMEFPGCADNVLPSETSFGPPTVIVRGAAGGRFVAANAPRPPGLFVRAPGGFEDLGQGRLRFGAGSLEWGVDGSLPVKGARMEVAGPNAVLAARPRWRVIVDDASPARFDLPAEGAVEVPGGRAKWLALDLRDVRTPQGELCRPAPPSWFEVEAVSGACLKEAPRLTPDGVRLAALLGPGPCAISVGLRGNRIARWSIEATTVAR